MNTKAALVIGFGVSGRASAALLLANRFVVTAVDRKAEELSSLREVQSFIERGLILVSENEQLLMSPFSLTVLSPGIELSHPFVQRVVAAGIEIIGEIDLALRYLPNQRVLAVTGTNGKTTTVLLIAHILNAAGIKAVAVGNVGAALSSYALHPSPDETLVLELSSFQLEMLSTGLCPFDVAMVLNITPNHLNRHSSMAEYAAIKLQIGAFLKKGGTFFVSRQVAQDFSVPTARLFDTSPLNQEDLAAIKAGQPEWQNIRAAHAVCSLCGISDDQFQDGLKTFRKPPHRIEWVAEINGVAYYNDSKASSVEAVMHAVRLFRNSLVLIAGGVDKGSSYQPWISCFSGKVKRVLVFGAAAEKMQNELAPHLQLVKVNTLQEAFAIAHASAESGDTILLSPGCSSYDQFVNYEERGETFKKLVFALCNGR